MDYTIKIDFFLIKASKIVKADFFINQLKEKSNNNE